MFRFVVIALSLQLAASLQMKSNMKKIEAEIDNQLVQSDEPECTGCSFAYVTMWIDRDQLPAAAASKQVFPVGMTLKDSSESEMALSEQQESDAQDAIEKTLAGYTNHLGGKDSIWELAGNLASVGSKYPLIVLTNDKNGILNEQDELKAKYPNIDIVQLKDDYLLPSCTMRDSTITHLQKLNVLGMDRYDKLLYVDTDVRLRKSLDSVFQLNVDSGAYFMKDDWYCKGTTDSLSSGLMLFKPSKKLLEFSVETSQKMGDCQGDQAIIKRSFKDLKMKMKVFPDKDIRYPQCDRGQQADALHFAKTKRGSPDPKKTDM